jgi:hypothetical protein
MMGMDGWAINSRGWKVDYDMLLPTPPFPTFTKNSHFLQKK